MNKLLIINAHPSVDSTSSFSLNVFNYFMKIYKEQHSKDEIIEQVNLYNDIVPMIDQTILNAWEKLKTEQNLTSQEQEAIYHMNEVLKQFKSANKYIIIYPMYNFNVPSKLKDYIDNIMIAKETFKYTESGAVGLLNDRRSILVIQGSGSIYTNSDWGAEMEYSHKYLKSIFSFLGIEDYEIIRVEGTNILNKDIVLQKAYKEAEEAALRLATK